MTTRQSAGDALPTTPTGTDPGSENADSRPADTEMDRRSLARRRRTGTVSPIEPSDNLVPIAGTALPPATLDALPPELVTPLQYLVSRHLLAGDAPVPSPIAVVSGLKGEGVTTVAQALSIVLANDLDTRVCYVDLSWARPDEPRRTRAGSVGTASGLALPGLAEIVAGLADFEDAVHPTDDPRVWMIGPGQAIGHQRHLLARSPQLVDVIHHLAVHFEQLVLDLPPLLAGSEGVALLRLASAQVHVVRHGVTTIQQLGSVDDELVNVPSFGVVINRFHSRVPRRLRHLFT
jgi:Mrp family chromosome partitioning ATPase